MVVLSIIKINILKLWSSKTEVFLSYLILKLCSKPKSLQKFIYLEDIPNSMIPSLTYDELSVWCRNLDDLCKVRIWMIYAKHLQQIKNMVSNTEMKSSSM